MTKPSFVLLATLFVLCCASPLSAQTRFGIKAGYSHASMTFSEDYIDLLEFVGGEDLAIKSMPAYHAGAVLEFGFGGNFGLGTGVYFCAKGAKQEFSGTILNEPYTRTRNVRPMYVQVPLALTFRSHGFYASAGPYFGFAVAGKIITKTESGGSSSETSEDIDFGTDEGKDLSQTDYGAGLELGYELFGNLRISASYSLGLANVLPADEVEMWDDLGGKLSAKNNAFGLSLTYLFGGE